MVGVEDLEVDFRYILEICIKDLLMGCVRGMKEREELRSVFSFLFGSNGLDYSVNY